MSLSPCLLQNKLETTLTITMQKMVLPIFADQVDRSTLDHFSNVFLGNEEYQNVLQGSKQFQTFFISATHPSSPNMFFHRNVSPCGPQTTDLAPIIVNRFCFCNLPMESAFFKPLHPASEMFHTKQWNVFFYNLCIAFCLGAVKTN